MFDDFPAEDEIVETWQGDPTVPVVSLVCLTYMHDPFILDTLRSFVSQRTQFPFEIVCYDDCSSDGTRAKVLAFAKRYPNIVRTILPDTNQYSRGIKPQFEIITPACKGRYIACCEGDDFWSDTLKVQKQVEFLEQHPDYVLANHNIASVNSAGEITNPHWLPDYYKRDFSAEEVRLAWSNSQVQSILYRNLIRDIPNEMRNAPSGDVFFIALLGKFGKAKYMDDIKPSMYRQHGSSVFTTLSLPDKHDFQSQNFYWLYKYYKRLGHEHEARVLHLRHFERGFNQIPLSDIFRLLYVKLWSKKSKSMLSIQRG